MRAAFGVALAALALQVGAGDPVIAAAKKLVGSKEIKDGSIETRDLSAAARKSLRGKQGKPGAPGAPGAPGTAGAVGAIGAAGPDGAKGDAGSLDGVAAGGDLTGTFPNPTIKPGALTAADLGKTGAGAGDLLTVGSGGPAWKAPDFAPKLSRTITVRATGTPAENGTALLDAVNALNLTGLDADHRLRVQLEAGTYDLGSGSVAMPQHVDLAGTGQGRTLITTTGDTAITSGTSSAVRDLGVSGAGGTTASLQASAGGWIERVTAMATAGTAITTSTSGAPVTLIDTDATGISVGGNTSYGLNLFMADAFVIRGRFMGTGSNGRGIRAGAAGDFRDTTISGDDFSLNAVGGSSPIRIAHSVVVGAKTGASVTTCFASVRADLVTPVGSTCG